jgi:hypothetical protein
MLFIWIKMMNFILIIIFDVARRELGGTMGFVTLLILFFYT